MLDNKKESMLSRYIQRTSQMKEERLRYDFMPSLLEIIERPSHIAGSVIVLTIFTLVIVTGIWASVSRIDIVVRGTGTVQPSKESSKLYSQSTGFIDLVHVKEGDRVVKGQTILSLDQTVISTQVQQIQQEVSQLETQISVYQQLISDVFQTLDLSSYKEGERSSIDAIISEQTYYQELWRREGETIRNQYAAMIREKILTFENKLSLSKLSLEQAKYQMEHLILKAPINGRVLSLAQHHTGELLTQSSPVAVLLPDDVPYTFTGYLSDKDMADVAVGDAVEIKLSAYPYADYGSIAGQISSLGSTAIKVEGHGMVYEIVIDPIMKKLPKGVQLKSGLSGSFEIKQGSRTVLEYFLDPIVGGLDDSLKEK